MELVPRSMFPDFAAPAAAQLRVQQEAPQPPAAETTPTPPVPVENVPAAVSPDFVGNTPNPVGDMDLPFVDVDHQLSRQSETIVARPSSSSGWTSVNDPALDQGTRMEKKAPTSKSTSKSKSKSKGKKAKKADDDRKRGPGGRFLPKTKPTTED
jgi:hypothetical protein